MENQLLKITSKTPTFDTKVSPNKAYLFGVDMASGHDETVTLALEKAMFFTDKSQRILDGGGDISVCNMVSAITTLAILNASFLHIHVSYHAHVNTLEIRANPASRDYSLLDKYKLVKKWQVRLTKTDALTKLKALEDELIEFVGDAKDCLAGAV
jgi:hypothetical protein